MMPYGRGRRGFGARAGIAAGIFALGALLRFLLLIALLVIAWKVITLRSLWGRPDGAVQVVRERFARGEITEEEYRKRLAALS
jgi:putative membrane protein